MNKKTLFSIFNDSNNSFDTKENDETVLLLVRRHPFYIVVKLILFFVLFVLPLIIASEFIQFIVFYKIFGLAIFLYSLWCLILWIMIFYSITMYVLDVWIVTDHRIIDSTQHGFFNRSISELHLSRIQDISVKTDGFIQTLLKFGNLEVQTAGTENKFHFRQIPDPEGVKNQIMSHITATGNDTLKTV